MLEISREIQNKLDILRKITKKQYQSADDTQKPTNQQIDEILGRAAEFISLESVDNLKDIDAAIERINKLLRIKSTDNFHHQIIDFSEKQHLLWEQKEIDALINTMKGVKQESEEESSSYF
ncbi:hypothetical protein M153_6003000392 [Pseudoloma neurophilia]|uniref:Uncharacterized protein n=1 Tax=Pseudoloma neurophilia TaxID=146866 RepID=A0A0R0LSI9_9MICR|nr:hypothetical protein M153_6003000392 [Pseudoloma neurophilia]